MNEYIFIMLQDSTGRKYFCNEKYLEAISQFAKNFNLQMFYVKSKKIKALTMNGLAKAFCNQNYIDSTEEYEVLSAIKPPAKRPELSVRTKKIKSV
jgi:hypothetical protein